MKYIKSFFRWLRRCISPVYVMMFIAAFILWYSTKLGDTYTTEHEVVIVVAGEEHSVDCTIRGKGTDLVGYTLWSRGDRFTIPLGELSFEEGVVEENDSRGRHISAVSLQQAIAARMSDVEVLSVGTPPTIDLTSIVSEMERTQHPSQPQTTNVTK